MRTVRGRFQDLDLDVSIARGPGTRRDDPHLALACLLRVASDPFAMGALREIASRDLGISAVYRCTDGELLDQIARQVAAGRLCLVPRDRPARPSAPEGSGALPPREPTPEESAEGSRVPLHPVSPQPPTGGHGPAPSSPTPAPPATPAPSESAPTGVVTPWITVRLIDDATGAPAANVRLRLRKPDGTVGIYTTDAAGSVHLTDLPSGTCDLEEVMDEDALEVVRVE